MILHKTHGTVPMKNRANYETYFKKIERDSKKPERCVPAPNHYSPHKSSLSTIGAKAGKEKRDTLIDEIQKYEKKKVGPA